ncbi:MAG: AAA family ATPase, partial [Gammaproteobacteria bacterium]|nr:AAA family ATPase [Gammaproteobacteria bacterium]
MITREITSRLIKLFNQYPIVTVMGPRQSGKTTLCRSSFPGLAYVNLESPDVRELAQTDPKLFLSRLDKGAVIDEVQRVPDLLSWLQVLVDEKRCNSLFVLTGSEQFQISRSISQSLAGRTALLRLLPFSFSEYQLAG